MPQWLQFVANHRIILWLLAGLGVITLLNSTVFYARLSAAARRLTKSHLVEEAVERQPYIKPLLSIADSMNGATWTRVAGIFQGIVLASAGLAGLLLL